MQITSCGMTDVGRKRNHNEDNFLVNDELQLFIVCDGMGGHAGGEVASAIAIHAIEEAFEEAFSKNKLNDPSNPFPEDLARENLRFAVLLAGRRIYEAAQADRSFKGMGTTCVALFVLRNNAYIGHVGDSRCYMVRDQEITQITEDHSWVNEQIQAGLLTEKEGRNHKLKNVITRSLGFNEEVEVDILMRALRSGDQILMCSDGLSNLVEAEEIKDHLMRYGPQAAARQLINLACERGGDDNITVLILKLEN